ncbi:glycosyltransferase family 2 protein [Pseudophaeobacter sp.]|uniref:glycosyltransferase family 2 protein n=1 Tax=Pseudophaeobacter sp. TaxID=1971739 RepID=UPI0032999DC2
MKFSCVMTAFNEGELLAQSIASVLNQTHEDLQLVLVDDGADAETRQVLQAQEDPRITLLRQNNDGLSSARNRGLRHCSGDYICFLDGDDLRAPWSFAELAALLQRQPVELVLLRGALSQPAGPLTAFMDEDSGIGGAAAQAAGADLGGVKAWAASYEPQSANKVLSRGLISRAQLSFPNDHFFEDILFHVMAIAQARSLLLPEARSFTYFRRQHRPQLTGANSEIRFDVIGACLVMFQLLRAHPEFANVAFRGAVSIGALRLLRWCEARIARHQLPAYQCALRAALARVDPRFFTISADTPDPRGEGPALQRYALGHLMA